MRRIVLVLVAVGALTGVVADMAPHRDSPMERPPQSPESKSPPDTATGG